MFYSIEYNPMKNTLITACLVTLAACSIFDPINDPTAFGPQGPDFNFPVPVAPMPHFKPNFPNFGGPICQFPQQQTNKFKLSFQWACRNHVAFSSCRGQVLWNGKEVFHISPRDYNVNTKHLVVEVKEGKNTLQFKGQGKSDSYGLTIDNVKLVRDGDSENIVRNGGFELPDVNGGWKIFDNIPGWRGHQTEVGRGTIYNGKWKSQVVELDSNLNAAITQTFSFDSVFNLLRLDYTLSFEWSSRTSGGRGFNSQTADIIWNGFVVGTLKPKNNHIQKASFDVELEQGDNHLEIRATGHSDCYGLVVDNVQLSSDFCDANLIVNGDFEVPALAPHKWKYIHGGFKGWKVKVGEVGDCRIYNPAWNSRGDNQCIELDSNGNQHYVQTVHVSAKKFLELLDKSINGCGCGCGNGFKCPC